MAVCPLVLIIDDEPEHAEIVALLLERRGHLTATARDGRSGLEMVRRLRPDLVLLDVRLPGVDGFAVAEELAGDADTRGVPIVFVTALGTLVGDQLRGRPKLEKPFRAAELYRVVENVTLARTSR